MESIQSKAKDWAEDEISWLECGPGQGNKLSDREKELVRHCYHNAAIKGYLELNANKDAVWLARRAVMDDCEKAKDHSSWSKAKAARTLYDLLRIWKNRG